MCQVVFSRPNASVRIFPFSCKSPCCPSEPIFSPFASTVLAFLECRVNDVLPFASSISHLPWCENCPCLSVLCSLRLLRLLGWECLHLGHGWALPPSLLFLSFQMVSHCTLWKYHLLKILYSLTEFSWHFCWESVSLLCGQFVSSVSSFTSMSALLISVVL